MKKAIGILGLLILITALLIQLSDSQIDEHNKQIFIKQNIMNEKLSRANQALEIFNNILDFIISQVIPETMDLYIKTIPITKKSQDSLPKPMRSSSMI